VSADEPVSSAMTETAMFYPMSYFYEQDQYPLPAVRRAEPGDLPAMAEGLLVRDSNLTPALESAHGGRLAIQVLRHSTDEGAEKRLVSLVLEPERRPVGFAAIHIYTERLPAAVTARVLARSEPFGRILKESGVAHFSRPVAFFDVAADAVMMEALAMEAPCVLYGRRSTIWNASGEALADVVEILAPPEIVV